MRLVALLVLVAACQHVEPTPTKAQQPTPIVETPPKPVTPAAKRTLRAGDWPLLIGKPAAEALPQYLGVDDAAELTPLGIELHVHADKIDTIFLHIQPEFGRGPVYRGELFRGVEHDMTRDQIIALLGKPDVVGEGGNNWIKYMRPEAQIHFSFGDKDALAMITLMRPDWTPGSP